MRYKVVKADLAFSIIETTTDLVIDKFEKNEYAKDYCRFLNFGGAFDGWTPRFVLKKINVEQLENGELSYK